MKTTKIFYWVLTSVVALMMYYSTYAYLTSAQVTAGFHHLGFPDYFRVELAAAKFIGATILLVPFYGRIKEWAYSGFTIVFISAFIAHNCSGDPVANRIMPVIFFLVLAGSYYTYRKALAPGNVGVA
jgi:hypothetical protein